MTALTEIRLKVTRRVNLGGYEHVEVEGYAVVSRDNDNDTPTDMRERALEEVNALLEEAYKDHIPSRRRRAVDNKDRDY